MKRSAVARYNSVNSTSAEERLNSYLQTYPFVFIVDETERKRPRRSSQASKNKLKRQFNEEPFTDSEVPVTSEDSPFDDSTNSSTETIQGEGPSFFFNKSINNLTSDISPPPTKVRRMQVGAGNSTATASSSSGKSVAERLKERRKDAHNKNLYNNGNNKDAPIPSCSTLMSKTTVPTPETKPIRIRPQLNERQKNTLRVINQYLRELGMHDTVETLIDESGCREEDPLAVRLRNAIKSREWFEALNIIDSFKEKINPRDHTIIRVAIIEELIKKYFMLRDYRSILLCLQHQYPREKEFADRRKFFVTMLAEDPEKAVNIFKEQENIAVHQQLTLLVEDFFPRTFMLASGRLEQLLNQSYEAQLNNCSLHIGKEQNYENDFILRDHNCPVQEFPCKTTQIIKDHDTEVWVLKFSPCGKYLASAGKSGLVFIWKVKNAHKLEFYNRFIINDDIDGISSLSWSSDCKFIACGSSEPRTAGIYVFNAHEKSNGNVPVEPHHIVRDKFSVADFFPSKGHRIACGDTRGNFAIMNFTPERRTDPTYSFEGYRIRSLVCLKNGKTVLAADTLHRIRSYDFHERLDKTIITENSPIVSFTVDKQEKHCLITTKDHGIRMWCMETSTLIRSFYGSVHKELIVNACFGGNDDNFIASGTEINNSLLIWKRTEEKPIKILEGHNKPINSVAWNPKFKNMLVSGSDDNTIRVWSTDPINSYCDDIDTNKAEAKTKKMTNKKQAEKRTNEFKNGRSSSRLVQNKTPLAESKDE